MGYLRLWLALGVLFYHFGLPAPLRAPDGGAMVRCFFVISGYVLALVLEGRYRGRLKKYYASRALRVYPAYLITLLASWALLAYGASVGWFRGPVALWRIDPPGLWMGAWMILQQAVLLGLDLSLHGTWHGHPASFYYLIPHTWSLGTELGFYLVAPWMVLARTRLLLLLVLGSAALRLIDPTAQDWPPSFPLEAGYFALGILAYRYRGLLEAIPWPWLALALVALPQAWGSALGDNALLPVLTAGLLPGLAAVSGRWPLDRSAGDLAYPLYLLHPMIGVVLMPLWVKDAAPWPRFGMLLAATLLLTAVFFVVVEQPLERWRRRRIEAL